jgi:AcrR family transcriptional regulator
MLHAGRLGAACGVSTEFLDTVQKAYDRPVDPQLSLDDVRDGVRLSKDPRARRTRAALLAAAEALMLDPAADISVTSITTAAGVSRSVFYTHFSGVDDLAAAILEAAIEQIGADDATLRTDGALTGSAALRTAVTRLVGHVESHLALYAAVLTPTSASLERAIDAYQRQAVVTLEGLRNIPPGLDRRSMARYFAAGSLAVVVAWIRDDDRAPREELIDFLVAMLPPWFAGDEDPSRR